MKENGKAIFDLLFEVELNNVKNGFKKIGLLLNVESQATYNPGYHISIRGIFYASRLISKQKDTYFENSNYDDIRKVYSIWICLNAPKKLQNTIQKFEFKQTAGVKVDDKLYNLIVVIAIYIGDDNSNNNVIEFIKLLFSTAKSSDERDLELKEKYAVDLKKEVPQMGSFGEAILYRGIGIGEARGLVKAYKSVNMPKEEIVINLINILKCSEEDALKYVEMY